MNISSTSANVPVDSALKQEKIKPDLQAAKVSDTSLKSTAQPKTQTKDQAKLEALGKTGQAQATLSLEPDYQLKHTKSGAQVTGFPPGNPPAFETILRDIFPDAESIELIRTDSQRPYDKSVFNVDGQSVEVSFMWGGFLPGNSVEVTALEGQLPPFKEILQSPSDKKIPLSDPGKLFPKSEPISFDIKKSANGGFGLSGFPAGSPPPLKAVLAEIFPDAKDIQILGESHDRPFDIYQFQVDGQNYEYKFLFGGIIASSQASIQPID